MNDIFVAFCWSGTNCIVLLRCIRLPMKISFCLLFANKFMDPATNALISAISFVYQVVVSTMLPQTAHNFATTAPSQCQWTTSTEINGGDPEVGKFDFWGKFSSLNPPVEARQTFWSCKQRVCFQTTPPPILIYQSVCFPLLRSDRILFYVCVVFLFFFIVHFLELYHAKSFTSVSKISLRM